MGRLRTLVGDGTYLTVGEAMDRLKAAGCPASDSTVRAYIERDQLRAWYTGGGHARIEPDSVDELVPVLKMKKGAAKDAAMEELRRKNRGETG